MYMRIRKTRYKSHNAVEKEIIELHIDTHTMKLINVQQVVLCFCLTIVCLYSIINNNDHYVVISSTRWHLRRSFHNRQIKSLLFKKKKRTLIWQKTLVFFSFGMKTRREKHTHTHAHKFEYFALCSKRKRNWRVFFPSSFVGWIWSIVCWIESEIIR